MSEEAAVVEVVAEPAESAVEAVAEAVAVEAVVPVVEAVAEVVVEAAAAPAIEAVEAVTEAPAVEAEAVTVVVAAPAPVVEAVVEAAPACKLIPKFDDLGKSTKDLLSKNYHFGVLKLESKTKTSTGAEFTVEGGTSLSTGDVCASLETKGFPAELYGFSLKEKWSTNNNVTATLSNSKLVCGLNTDLDMAFDLASGKRSAKLKNTYKRNLLNSTLDLDLSTKVLDTSAVVDVKGVLIGGKATYDLANKSLAHTNFSLAALPTPSTAVHFGVIDLTKYVASIHQNICNKIQLATTLSYNKSASDPWSFEIGGQYALDDHSFMKTKIDCSLNLGCSYVTKVREGVQLTLSSLINAKQFSAGGHQVGVSLNLSA